MRQLTLSVTIVTGLFIGGVLHAREATATTYYVATNGDDSRSCGTAQNISTPKATITNGITCLSGGGDTLLIRGGTYVENVTTPTASGSSYTNSILIGAYKSETATIRANGGNSSLVVGGGGDYIVFDKLHVDGANSFYAIAAGVGGWSGNNGHVRFQNGEVYSSGSVSCPDPYTNGPINIFVNPGSSNIEFLNNDIHHSRCQYGFYVANPIGLIEGNKIHDNPGHGIQLYNGTTSCCIDNVIIRNNTIYNNGFLHGHDGITAWYGSHGLVYNNVIYGNAHCGISIGRDTNDHQIYNNTVYNNTACGIYVAYPTSAGTLIRNNILYQNGNSIIDTGTATVQSNNLTTVPQFVDAAGNDFHLQATSLAINAGIALSAVSTDINGVPRPQGAGYDIGAYEYTASQISPLPTPKDLKIISVAP